MRLAQSLDVKLYSTVTRIQQLAVSVKPSLAKHFHYSRNTPIPLKTTPPSSDLEPLTQSVWSDNKRNYLINGKEDDFEGHQLSVKDIEQLAIHYKNKFGISIFSPGAGKLKKRSAAVGKKMTFNRCKKEARTLAKSHKTFVGYAAPDRAGSGVAHIETLIAGKRGEIFNLIPFGSCFGGKTFGEKYYHSDIAQLMSDLISASPQATSKECGSLGTAYLKEYLKNNAEQLKVYTLKIDIREQRFLPPTQRFLLPSPQALRYAQSFLYTKLIHAMVAGEDGEVTVTQSDGKIFKVPTLKGMLNKNTTIRTIGNRKLSEKKLDDFRKKWLSAYEVSMEKRAMMTDAEGKNRYLSYLSRKNEKKIQALSVMR